MRLNWELRFGTWLNKEYEDHDHDSDNAVLLSDLD